MLRVFFKLSAVKNYILMILLYLLAINNIDHSLDNDDIIKLGLSLAEGSLSKIDYKNFIITKIIRDA